MWPWCSLWMSTARLIGTHAGRAFLLSQQAGLLSVECLPSSLCGSKYRMRSRNREPVFMEAASGPMVPQAMLLLQSEGGAISGPESWVFPTVEEGV